MCEGANLDLCILLLLPSGLGMASFPLCFLSTLPGLLVCGGALQVVGLDLTLFRFSAMLARLRAAFSRPTGSISKTSLQSDIIIWVRSEICSAKHSNMVTY